MIIFSVNIAVFFVNNECNLDFIINALMYTATNSAINKFIYNNNYNLYTYITSIN